MRIVTFQIRTQMDRKEEKKKKKGWREGGGRKMEEKIGHGWWHPHCDGSPQRRAEWAEWAEQRPVEMGDRVEEEVGRNPEEVEECRLAYFYLLVRRGDE